MAQNPQSAYRSWLGVSKDTINANFAATYPAGATTFALTNVVGVPLNTHAVVIMDGANTETLDVTSWTAGTSTLVATAAQFAHSANVYMFFQVAGAVGPTAYVPITKLDFSDQYDQLYDKSFRGSQAVSYGAQQGPRLGNFSLDGDLFADTFGYLASSFFGAYDFATSISAASVIALSASGYTVSASVTGTFLPGQSVTLGGSVSGGSGNWAGALGTYTVATGGTNVFTYVSGASVSGSPTVTSTTVSTPNAYRFSPQNTSNGQPPSYIFWDYNPGNSNLRVYVKAVLSDLTIKLDPAALTGYTVTGEAFAGRESNGP